MSSTEPRTMREAYAALVLEELDELTRRVEALPGKLSDAERALTVAAAAVGDAGDRYRAAVTTFNEEAKADLTAFLERRAGQVADETIAKIRGSLIQAAQDAFRSEANDKATSLSLILTAALHEFRASSRARFVEHAVTAFVAAGVTAGLVWLVIK